MLKHLPILLAILFAALPAAAEQGPRPPCGGALAPASATVGSPPAVGLWTGGELRKAGWRPPACLGWRGDSRFVATLSGDFASRQTGDQLLARLTDFAAYPSIRYWSVTHKEWRPLALEAGAPKGLDLTPGRDNAYFERGVSSGKTTYRLRALERSENRIVVATENVTPIRLAIVTAFDPAALQTVSFLERRGPEVWRFHQIIRAGEGASSLVDGREGSFVNRLGAIHRYMAGLQTDLEPALIR